MPQPTAEGPESRPKLDLADVVWETYKLQELGLLQYSDAGPGLTIDPPEKNDPPGYNRAAMILGLLRMSDQAHGLLGVFTSVHDDVFAPSPLRLLRRLLPIPGIYQAAPYHQHARSLGNVVAGMKALESAAASQVDEHRTRPRAAKFLLKLQKYSRSLRLAASSLDDICIRLHAKQEGGRQLSLVEYNAAVSAYEQLRATAAAAGSELNSARDNLKTMVGAPVR